MTLKRILIVDDSSLMQRTHRLVLMRYQGSGVEIETAGNGREALSCLHQHPDTDLILLDINMPVMNGLEFLRHRQTEGVFQDVPVVIISTEDKEEDVVRALEAGARAYLFKPYDVHELHRLLDRILKGERKETSLERLARRTALA